MAGAWRPTGVALLTSLVVGAMSSSALGQDDDDWDDDLADLDLEALMAIPVTSVAGVAQPLGDTPAACLLTGRVPQGPKGDPQGRCITQKDVVLARCAELGQVFGIDVHNLWHQQEGTGPARAVHLVLLLQQIVFLGGAYGNWEDERLRGLLPADPYPVELAGGANWRPTQDKIDALGFPPAEGEGHPVQREVIEPDLK